MDLKVVAGAIQASDADAIVVNLFEGVQPGGATKAVDDGLGGAMRDLIEGGDFSGQAGQVAVLYPRGALPARRVIVVGLGPRAGFEGDAAEAVRHAAASAIQKARDLKARRVASILHGAGAGGLSVEEAAQATAEGSLLGLYAYRGQKTGEHDEPLPQALELVVLNERDVAAAQRGANVASAI
ncbi:MAG TPA: M17 family peptidase N-terminal domain-containing protein, partial [Anaerolineae bacterium]|nr:M17 family peptidase N-terminal domain-containing protein [Anaerolineae bacterium]